MLTVMSIKLADFPEVLVQRSHLFSLIKTQLQIFISEKSIARSECEQKENKTSSQEEEKKTRMKRDISENGLGSTTYFF